MTRFSVLVCTILLAACSQARVLHLNYTKPDVSDSQAAEDRAALKNISGVDNVVLEHGRDNIARFTIFVDEGKELSVYAAAESMGYTRIK